MKYIIVSPATYFIYQLGLLTTRPNINKDYTSVDNKNLTVKTHSYNQSSVETIH